MLRPASHTLRTLVVVIAFLLLIPFIFSQPTPLNADDFIPESAAIEPAEMDYKPSPEAESFAELMAVDTVLNPISAPISFPAQLPEQVSITQTIPVTATTLTTLYSERDNAVSINNDQLGVVIESGTFTQTAALEFTLLAVAPADPVTPISPTLPAVRLYEAPKTFLSFQVEAVDSVTTEPIATFNKQVRLSIDVRDQGYEFPDHGMFFLAYRSEEDPNEWIDVPVTVYEPGFYSADVDHFSDWTTGWRPDGWTLAWNLPSADGFSGASTYAYPFQLPPGRNGLQPSLALTYSDSALNGATRRVSAGTVAAGWSLSQITIVRTGVELSSGLTSLVMPDKFRLVLNGTGYKLSSTSQNINGGIRYTAENGPQLFVLKYTDYWVVITGEGTLYRLGYTTESRTGHYLALNAHLGTGGTYDDGTIEWHVDTVTDTSGNQVIYQYNNNDTTDYNRFISYCPWGGICTVELYTKASRLTDIYYNFSNRITALPPAHNVARLNSADAATHIELLYNEEGNRFSNLLVYHKSNSPIREYAVNSGYHSYQNPGCPEKPGVPRTTSTYTLRNITEYGWNNATGIRYALPTTNFGYVGRRNFTDADQACFIYHHLKWVTNGYGGRVEFDYNYLDRRMGDYTYDGNGPLTYPDVGFSHYVVAMRQMDGRGNTSKITYGRYDPCYNEKLTAQACPADEDAPDYGVLAGFARVETFYWNLLGTAWERQEETLYHTDPALHGLAYEQYLKDSNNDVRQSSLTSHHTTLGEFHPVAQVITTWYVDGLTTNSMSNRVTYDYVPGDQGGTQYGNLTHIREYTPADASSPYRITRRFYKPNTDTANNHWYWLVSLMRSEAVYATENGTPLTVQYLYYDGQGLDTSPTKGRLTRSRQGDPSITCADVPVGWGGNCVTAHRTIDTFYTYDDAVGNFGNLLTTSNYTNYGYQTFDANGTPQIDYLPTGTPRTTTIVYDVDYKLYPVKITDPGGYITTFDVYGFKNWNQTLVSVDGFSRQTGLLKQVTGANGLITLYEYDPFGRLTNTYDALGDRGTATNPWDGNPITRYQYFDNDWQGSKQLDPANNRPFPIVVRQRPGTYHTGTGGTGYEFKQVTYYDGLGRPIQSQDRWLSVDGYANRQDRIVTTAYNAWGQTTCTTVPYTVDTYTIRTGGIGSGFLTNSCTTLARTTTQYDDLGRPISVTDPANIITSYTYTIESVVTVDGYTRLSHTNVTDANNHVTGQFTNALGQLVLVREYGDASHEADTRYTYDLLGNLTAVGTSTQRNTQPAVNEFLRRTTMTYDAFGRKTGMTDPDMGTWSYTYDAAGNLTRQQDAKAQVLCFTYDALNRILSKTQDNPVNGCITGDTILATYYYFGPNNGVSTGQVSEIRWPNTNNRDLFSYNSKGLLDTHTRWIDGRSYELTYGGYDLFNRPTTLTYPDEEVVQMSYDREGENSLTITSSPHTPTGSLVDAVAYNAQGQMVRLERGNGVDTAYTYWPTTGNSNSGDNNGRLWTLQHGSTTDALPDFTYHYDKVGNITSLETAVRPAGYSYNFYDLQAYQYDERNRLDWAGGSNVTQAGFTGYTHDYQYDKLGNLVDMNGGVADYNYSAWNGACNTPTQPLPHAVRQIGTDYFCYDNNGNMTKRVVSNVTYDQGYDGENRLISVSTPGNSTTTSFVYDASGQRTQAIALTTSGGVTSRVITTYPFPNYEEERHQTLQFTGCNPFCPGGTWVTNTTITRRLYSLAGQVIATRVVGDQQQNNGLFYFLGDHLGSTRMLTDTGGSVVSGTTAHFLPYGSYRGDEPAGEITDKGYTGHKQNDSIGLIYMNARYYVPYLNRFISADSIIPQPTDPQSYNRYSYTRNNPVNLIDPSGHKECGVSSDCSEIPTWFHNWRSSILQRGANAIVSLLPAPPRAVPGGWRSTSVNYRDSFGKYATDSAPDGDVYIYYRVDANSKDDLLGFERVGRSILQENEAGFLYDDANYQEEYAGTFPKDPIAMAYIQFHKIADANYEWDKVHNDHQAAEPRLTITGNYSPKASDRAHWVALGVEQGWLYDTSWGADRYFHVDHRASYDGGTILETTVIGNYAVYGDVTSASLYFQGWSGPFFSEGGPYSWQVNKNLPVP